MAILRVRKLEPELIRVLEDRAKRNHRSVEDEVIKILQAALDKEDRENCDRRDTMIAGIVLASHATLATRNVKHFDDIAKSVVNPWEA